MIPIGFEQTFAIQGALGPALDALDGARPRRKTGLSQAQFAAQFGLSLATLRNWEQGHREPPGVARVLLTLIDRMPERVQEALRTAG